MKARDMSPQHPWECWQCYCGRMGGQHTNGPCRCYPCEDCGRHRSMPLDRKYCPSYAHKRQTVLGEIMGMILKKAPTPVTGVAHHQVT